MDKMIKILKAVSDTSRVRILLSLSDKELCVCQITAMLGLAPSTVSKHISILKHAGFVSSRKSGKWIFYRLNLEEQNFPTSKIFKIIRNELENSKQILSDQKKLREVLREDVDKLCSRICCSKNKKAEK
ncbi:MAG: metalloregulator ArsR/SmtB family transcription factor [Victivallales bacterium]|nr:metalloregulator ArsR/SmtB family transcription factor [Victivallales bacterium]